MKAIVLIFLFTSLIFSNVAHAQTYELQQHLSRTSEIMSEAFDIPAFRVDLKYCGEKNAYSLHDTGDIVICQELLADPEIQNHGSFLIVVLFHEMSHTLLNLWGQPNFDNERTADELATVLMFMLGGGEHISGWIELFKKGINPIEEARMIVLHMDNHPLTVQRADAVQKIILNPDPYIKRWNKVLYPHMKSEILQEIINSPDEVRGADVELAQEILNSRN